MSVRNNPSNNNISSITEDAFSFPSANNFPSSLSPLLDKTSSYTSVARVCLALTQEGCTGDYLWNDTQAKKQISTAIQSLTTCINSHTEDSCRIVASNCLAIYARSAFFKARSSGNDDPLLTGSLSHEIRKAIEDECAVDVPQTLCNVALEATVADAVSAAAFWSLGLLLSGSSSDSLLNYIQQVAFFNNTINKTQNDEIMDFQEMHNLAVEMDFSIRILTNVIVKKLRQLLHRASSLQPRQLQMQTLPFLTCCIQQVTSKALGGTNIVPGMISLVTYAKRWFAVDIILLQEDFVQTMLLPQILSGIHGPLSVACAVSLIRLISTTKNNISSSTATWIVLGCSAACSIFLQTLSEQQYVLESKASIIAMIISATQVLPWDHQMSILLRLLSEVSFLHTEYDDESSPKSSDHASCSFFCNTHFSSSAIKSRVGLLTECLLQSIIGCCQARQHETVSIGISMLLSDSVIAAALKDRKNLFVGLTDAATKQQETSKHEIHFAEEVVLSFTCCLFQMIGGNDPTVTNSSTRKNDAGRVGNTRRKYLQEFLRCSIIILNDFAPCLCWNHGNDQGTSKLGCDAIGQSYLDLLEHCLYITGIIDHRLIVQHRDKTHTFSSSTEWGIIRDPDLKLKTRHLLLKTYQLLVDEGIPLQNVRIRLLSLFPNYFTAPSSIEEKQHYYDYARTILQFLGTDIRSLLLQTRSSSNKNRCEGAHQRFLLAKCAATIELIASTACDKLSSSDHSDEILRLCFDAFQIALLPEGEEEGVHEYREYHSIHAAMFRIKQNIEKTKVMPPSDASAVPLWVFARSNEDAIHSIVSEVSGAAAGLVTQTYQSEKNCTTESAHSTGKDNWSRMCLRSAAEIKRFLFWKIARLSVFSRASNVFDDDLINTSFGSSCDEERNNERSTILSAVGGDDANRENSVLRNTKGRKPIYLAVTEQPQLSSTLSSIGASLWKTKTGTYPFMGWTNSFTTLTGASDPIVAMLSFKTQQSSLFQHPGANGNKRYLVVTIRVFNVMAVPITHEVCLDISVCQLSVDCNDVQCWTDVDKADSISPDHYSSLENNRIFPQGEKILSTESRVPLTYCFETYKGEISPYDCITWTLEIDVTCPGDIELLANITFRDVHLEESYRRFQQVNCGSAMINVDLMESGSFNSNRYEDDASSSNSFGSDSSLNDDKSNDGNEVMDVSFPCEPVIVPSIVMLLPCSLVFSLGKADATVFDILWTNMSNPSFYHCRIQLKRNATTSGERMVPTNNLTNGPAAQLLARRASLTTNAAEILIRNDAWAFMDWSGHRLLYRIVIEASSDKIFSGAATEESTMFTFLEARCDEKCLLMSIMKSYDSKSRFVSDLTDGLWLPQEHHR